MLIISCYQAKATGYFLVLVPLIAFCIRCVIGVFCTKIIGSSMRHHQETHQHGSSRGMRWKSALLEPKEAGTMDAGSATDVSPAWPMLLLFAVVHISAGFLSMDYQHKKMIFLSRAQLKMVKLRFLLRMFLVVTGSLKWIIGSSCLNVESPIVGIGVEAYPNKRGIFTPFPTFTH